MTINSLQDLLLHELKDLYSAETQILEALPLMIAEVHNEDLAENLEIHLKETQDHVTRLKKVADILSISLEGETCDGMKGLLKEGQKVLAMDFSDMDVKDSAIIAATQRVEHYEIAGYGTAVAFADQIGLGEVSSLLKETLEEEGAANKKLTSAAEGGLFSSGINEDAAK